MKHTQLLIRNYTVIFNIVWIIFLSAGCSLKEIHEQTSLTDNLGSIKGIIKVTSDQTGPVMVLHFRDQNGIPALQRTLLASGDGQYEFYAEPGKHYIAAFVDVNKDGKYQPEEHGNYLGAPAVIEVVGRQIVKAEAITISGAVPRPPTGIKPIDRTLPVWKNIGSVVAMDDPRFTSENYTLGLWKPIDFLEKAEGGLFFLQEYQEKKVPVLFVHGVLNGPTLWSHVIENLDTKHFQPWVFYYPSGVRLDVISDYLAEAVSQVQHKYGFRNLYVVAHSMGGVVTRSFVKKYVQRDRKNAEILSLVVTVNSPMGGIAAAAPGVENSPIVVPSWRDVAPESEFLKDIYRWNWPEEIPYHLVISYLAGDSGDGVVPLQSQAQLKFQSEATRIYLFNNEHSGTIFDKEFHVMLDQIFKKRLLSLAE